MDWVHSLEDGLHFALSLRFLEPYGMGGNSKCEWHYTTALQPAPWENWEWGNLEPTIRQGVCSLVDHKLPASNESG